MTYETNEALGYPGFEGVGGARWEGGDRPGRCSNSRTMGGGGGTSNIEDDVEVLLERV